jgi:SAM-dependent methyltransferase
MTFTPRFGPAADAYSTFRPEYPPALFDRILAFLPPERRDCAMDLGAGTGKATRALVKLFARVIAVEPDPLMAEKLRDTEPRAEVRLSTAEECRQVPDSVDLVNIATALHWMDTERVMANVALWLRPGGILAVYGSDFPRTPGPIHAIIRQEFREHWDQFRDERLRRKVFPHSIVRAASSLALVEDTTIPFVLPMAPHEFAGFCRSTSYGSAYGRTLGDAEAQYWLDLESRFREAWREDKIPVDSSFYLFLSRKE